jgi:hypothetical protein
MGLKYRRMNTDQRIRHHDELRDEGYEWCPECGEVLVWDLPRSCGEAKSAGQVPVVTGDCPPLTREQLLPTASAQ